MNRKTETGLFEAMYLGISLTPQDLRCLVCDETGQIEISSVRPLTDETARDPAAWWQALQDGLADLVAQGANLATLQGISLAGTPEGAVFLDDRGETCRETLLAGDKGAEAWCDWLEATARRSRAITGNLARPDMAGVGLVQFRDAAPEAFGRLASVLAPRDYLVRRLTGKQTTDPTTASSSLLFDPLSGSWSNSILRSCGLEETLLPEVLACDARVGPVKADATDQPGLPPVPVIAGASDLAACALWFGLRAPGDALIALGKTTQVAALSDTFLSNPLRHIDACAFVTPDVFCHLADLGPATDFDAWAKTLGADDADFITRGIDEPDLYFLPHLGRGAAIAGLSPQTTPQSMAQAVLYGAAFEITEGLAAMEDLSPISETVDLMASPTLGASWGPYLASATGKTLSFHSDDGFHAARGAARLARKGVKDLSASEAFIRPEAKQSFSPQPDLQAHFEQIRPKLAGLKSRLTL